MEKQLNFADMCEVIYRNLKPRMKLINQMGETFTDNKLKQGVIALIFGITDKTYAQRVQDRGVHTHDFSSLCSKYFTGKLNVPSDIIDAYNSDNVNNVYGYISKNIYSQIESVDNLAEDLRGMLRNTPDFSRKEELLCQKNVEGLLADCLIISTNYRNRAVATKKRVEEHIKNEESKQKEFKINSSHAISLQVQKMTVNSKNNGKVGMVEFHDFERLLEYILDNDLLILKVLPSYDTVKVFVMESDYQLVRLTEKDYVDAILFLREYSDEFKPKENWPEYSIAKLAANGLKEGRWVAYGYYYKDELVGYIDFKYTVAKGVELGIELIADEHRAQALATSLLYFVRIKYPTLYTYSGTYEENGAMRGTFESAGYIVDKSEGMNGIKKDRVNLEYPNDKNAYTNSVYYIAKPLLVQYSRLDND